MSELPEDLLEEILYRVPAASLKRLRSTCKRWNGLFNDRRFARKHLDKATKQFLILMLKKHRVSSMIIRINLHSIPLVELIGELTLIHPRSLGLAIILPVSHCDGLVLCLTKDKVENLGLMVWNPCTGQTTLVINRHDNHSTYALGSYQDKISNDISYKILSHNNHCGDKEEFRIHEINSNSWRILDVTLDFRITGHIHCRGVSFKGKTYYIAIDGKKRVDILVSFDYTTEKFERLICLPHQYPILSLSVVREEKLSVLLQRDCWSKTEIWVTNKIGNETKVVSWSMLLTVDLGAEFRPWNGGSFLINEEKKVLVCCNKYLDEGKTSLHIVGEDNKVKPVDFVPGSLWPSHLPYLFNYVPSLIQT